MNGDINKPKVSIVIPAMNEEETIGILLDELNEEISKINYPVEIIVVDDHSSDKTSVIAAGKNAKVIQNLGKCGKGAALCCGFEHAQGNYIIMMDADCSHKPELIPQFISALENGAGLVVGSRWLGGSDEYNFTRAFGNIFLSTVLHYITGSNIGDSLNGFKGFKRELVKDYRYRSRTFEIEIEIIINALRAGYKIVEVPAHERERAGGMYKSRVIIHGTKFLYRILLEGIKYRLFG